MKKALSILILLLIPTICFASPEPEKFVEGVVKKAKVNGDMTVVLDEVHWKSMFNNLEPQAKAAMGVNSPEEMKSSMQAMFSDPGKFFRAKMANQMKMNEMPEEAKKGMEMMMTQMVSKMEQKIKVEMKDRLMKSEFKITGSKIDGDKGSVAMETVYQDKTDTMNVQVIKDENRWWLADLGDNNAGFVGRSAPAAAPAMGMQ